MVKPVVEKSLRVVGRGAGRGRADVVEAELVALVGRDRRLHDEVLAASGEADGLAVEGDSPTVSAGPRSSWKRGALRVARKSMTASPVSCFPSGPR